MQPICTAGEKAVPLQRQNVTAMRKLITIILILAAVVAAQVFTACNVTRVITNQSEYYQRGDTSVLIQTKIVETYDATRKQ